MSRMTREMFCLMEGRHVHPSTLYPGGVGTVPTVQLFTDYLVRLMKYVEFMKKVVPLHDDLFDFFYEALPGYEEVGQRRILLGCWGSFQDPRALRLHLQEHGRLGPQDVRHARRGGRRRTGHHQSGRHQPEHPHPAGQFLLRRLGRRRDLRHQGSAGQSGGSAPSLEPDHDSQTAEARFRRQVHLGHVAALVSREDQGVSGARHRRRADRTFLGHGQGRPGRHWISEGDGQ